MEFETVGRSTLALASGGGGSLGLTIFSEVIFYENKEAYDRFTKGSFEFQAEAKVYRFQAEAHSAACTSGSNEITAVAGGPGNQYGMERS